MKFEYTSSPPEKEEKEENSSTISPSYYKGGEEEGEKFEVIDVVEEFKLSFHEGNIVKYVIRHPFKNGKEDLQKAKWYLDRLIEQYDTIRIREDDGSPDPLEEISGYYDDLDDNYGHAQGK